MWRCRKTAVTNRRWQGRFRVLGSETTPVSKCPDVVSCPHLIAPINSLFVYQSCSIPLIIIRLNMFVCIIHFTTHSSICIFQVLILY